MYTKRIHMTMRVSDGTRERLNVLKKRFDVSSLEEVVLKIMEPLEECPHINECESLITESQRSFKCTNSRYVICDHYSKRYRDEYKSPRKKPSDWAS